MEAAAELVMVEDVAAEVLMLPFHGKHQKLEHTRTKKVISSPLAQETRARMLPCS